MQSHYHHSRSLPLSEQQQRGGSFIGRHWSLREDSMSQQPNPNHDDHIDDVQSNTASNTEKESGLSRRDFLKYSAGAVGATSLAGFLAACSAGGFGGGGSGGSSGGGGAVTINFWDMAWGGSTYFDVGKSLVNDFNNSHKGINV